MSRKQPEIKVIYPDASAAAMLLTDAMIRRSTGKRIVETNSEEKEYTGEVLFGGVLSTKTDTSVELTLRLNPDAMDYALTMLVAKNLTEEEKRAIRMETDSMEIVDLLSPAQAAADASTCTKEVRSASRADNAIDVPMLAAPATEQIKPAGAPGKDYSDIERLILNCLNDHLPDADYLTKTGIMHDMTRRLKLNIELRTKQHKAGLLSSVTLRMILHDMVDALGGSYAPGVVVSHIDAAVEEIDRECRSIELEDYEVTNAITAQLGLAIRYILALNDSKKDKRIHALFVLGQKIEEWYDHDVNINSYDIERAVDKADVMFDKTPPSSADPIDMLNEIRKYLEDGDPTWDDVEKEAQSLGKDKADKDDKAETEQDGEIEPGLLNDIDTEGEDHG